MDNHRSSFNPHKAGLDKCDGKKINEIIYNASKGSAFEENEQRKHEKTLEKIKSIEIKFQNAKNALERGECEHIKVLVDSMVNSLEKKRDLSRTYVHFDM
jgi:DNA polymerase kappa